MYLFDTDTITNILKKRPSLSFADLQIASVAIANNLTLITGNTKHFERISELKIDNWL